MRVNGVSWKSATTFLSIIEKLSSSKGFYKFGVIGELLIAVSSMCRLATTALWDFPWCVHELAYMLDF